MIIEESAKEYKEKEEESLKQLDLQLPKKFSIRYSLPGSLGIFEDYGWFFCRDIGYCYLFKDKFHISIKGRKSYDKIKDCLEKSKNKFIVEIL